MTGYTVHTGSSLKFAKGWDQVFKGRAADKRSGQATGNKSQQVERSAKQKKR